MAPCVISWAGWRGSRAPGGKVHVLDLVLPAQASAGRLLARLDRGRFARPIDHWRALFTEHLREEHFQPYAFGLPRPAALADGVFRRSPEVSRRRVTIAIPIHNEEEVLPELLRRVFAVLDQTPGGPHELLIVDDGSRDGSLRILEDAAERDPRLAGPGAVPEFWPPGRRVSGLRPRDRRRDDGDGRRSAGCARSPAHSAQAARRGLRRRVRPPHAAQGILLAAHQLSHRVSNHLANVEARAAGGRGRFRAAVTPRGGRGARAARTPALPARPAQVGRVPPDR